MTPYNASNERVKHRYFQYLREAKRQNEASVDAAAKALDRFEQFTRHRDFKSFHVEQAVAFKRRLSGEEEEKALSKATLYTTFAHLKRFFTWLTEQPGYRSRLRYGDAEYFNMSEKDARIATARHERPFPTLEQIKHVIAQMPATSDLERRNRALVAFAILTGARDSAIASMKLKHIDLSGGSVYQDARDVKTKFSKSFPTFFFQVGEGIREIFESWVRYLLEEKIWGNDDPLFPATDTRVGAGSAFEAYGIKRQHWRNAAPIRTIFKQAFTRAGLPYFNPHSFRSTLVQLAEVSCRTPEELKAWSQNLGHERVLTTLYSYGAVATPRQREIIATLPAGRSLDVSQAAKIARAVVAELGLLGATRTHKLTDTAAGPAQSCKIEP